MATNRTDHPLQAAGAGLSRREFLSRGAVATTALTVSACSTRSSAVRSMTRGAEQRPQRDVLVVVFLRGGMDGLSLCVPYGEDALYTLRPELAIPPPGSPRGAVDLDGFFALAPAARALYAPFRAGELAIVQAVGLQHPTRSHFDAMRNMEYGSLGRAAHGSRPGWIARLLAVTEPRGDSMLRAVAVERFLPAALAGSSDALAISDPRTFTVLGRDREDRRALAAMYDHERGFGRDVARNTLRTLEQIERTRFDVREPPTGEAYPDTEFGRKLALTSAWIRAENDVEVLTLDYGGWDHHRNLGAQDGMMAMQLDGLARGLSAFARDLGPDLGRVTLVAFSEFGRRAAENASGGLDHGHGGTMLVLGGHVKGGRVHGCWPTLGADALDDGDLAITTDARDVLAEIALERFGASALGNVFPSFEPRTCGVVS